MQIHWETSNQAKDARCTCIHPADLLSVMKEMSHEMV